MYLVLLPYLLLFVYICESQRSIMNLHSLIRASIETMRLPHRAIWPIAQTPPRHNASGRKWICSFEWCMGVLVEGPLFVVVPVVKSGLHSITPNGINSVERKRFSKTYYVSSKCKWKTLVNLLSTCQSPRCLPIYPHWANWRALCSRGGENNLQMRTDLTWGRSQTCH